MSRWKKLDNWEEKLEAMSLEEVRTELAFWKKRLSYMVGPARKGTLKQVHYVERVLRQKCTEQAAQDDDQADWRSPRG